MGLLTLGRLRFCQSMAQRMNRKYWRYVMAATA
jgi:hypothetical protein